MRKLPATALALLMLTPSLALAMGCHGDLHEEETAQISCAEGMTYDADAKECVETVG